MKYLNIIMSIIFLSSNIITAQTFSRAFLYENWQTIPQNIKYHNNDYILTGTANDTSISSGIRSFISKHDSIGNLVDINFIRPSDMVWFSTYGKMHQFDNDYITCGFGIDTNNISYFLVVIYDSLLQTKKIIKYPTGTDVSGNSDVTKRKTGGYYTTGVLGTSTIKPFITRLDDTGNIVWTKSFNIIPNYPVKEGRSIIEDDSGNVIMVAYTYKEFMHPDMHNNIYKTIIIKTDSFGNEKWRWVDTSNNGQARYSFQKTSDGGYISCGSYIGYRDPDDAIYYQPYIVKWNSDFSIQWQKWFMLESDSTTFGEMFDVKELENGNFIMCGWITKANNFQGVNGVIVNLKSNGEINWLKQYRSYNFLELYSKHQLYDLDILPNGDIIAVGEINPNDGISVAQQGWLLRVDSNGCIIDSNWCGWNSIEIEPAPLEWQATNELFLFPNPANDIINITFKYSSLNLSDKLYIRIFDFQGREIYNEKTNYKDLIQLNVSTFEKGIYFLKINTEDNKVVSNGKFVKE